MIINMCIAEKANHKKSDNKANDDADLFKRFKMGDENAFSSIVLKYQGRLLQVAKTIVGNENDAMDLSQDAFVKAYFNRKSFREDSSLYTWLYRILFNLCISFLRRKKIISFISMENHTESKNFISKSPDPSEEYERKEFRTAVECALEKLPLKQRMVFVMKQIDGLKHEEIARILGITEGGVRASYFHAVKKMQSILSIYGEDNEM